MRYIVKVLVLLLTPFAAAPGSGPVLKQDPFARPGFQPPATNSPASGASRFDTPAPELRATMSAGPYSLVNVNGTIIEIGEEIDGYRLVSVQEGEVVFEVNGREMTVSVADRLQSDQGGEQIGE